MKICLIIINYEGELFLTNNIVNLKKGCANTGIDLFVTDDVSKDASIFFLKSESVDYTVNLNDNHGFASNVNNGIKFASAKDHYDFFLISNNDIDTRSIDFNLLKANVIKANLTFKKIGLIGFKESHSNFNKNLLFTNLIIKTNEIPGFFFAISKELIQEIGYLDEEYFMYGEDNDYFFRTLKAGYEIVQVDQNIIHFSEGSTKNKHKTSWLVYRNAGLFAVKNLNFYESVKYFLSFINIIFNPFYTSSHPSYIRVKRSGILVNTGFLIASILWNLKKVISNQFKKYENRHN
jgi:hypothetical protein